MQVMIVTHTGLGLLLVTLVIAFAAVHLLRVWKRRHPASIATGLLLILLSIVLMLTGLLILTDAASRDNRWAWWTHVAVSVAGPLLYAVHRKVSHSPGSRRSGVRFVTASAVVMALLLVFHVAERKPAAPGRAGETADFSPSPATLSSSTVAASEAILGRAPVAGQAARIGSAACEGCHQDVVAQWATSAHRFSSFNNPFYEASVAELRARNFSDHTASSEGFDGNARSQWCGACHDPALLFTGQMEQPIETLSQDAQAGLTCLACHAINSVHDQTGNGNYNLNDVQQDPYLFSDRPSGSVRRRLHDAVMKARPEPHRQQMLTPLSRQPEFCATCHKVSIPEAVNDYRWLRGQNEYDNWHDSGVAGNAARTFYLPETARSCQDCHMPLVPAELGDLAANDGLVRSHRFLAANTALPFLRGDGETVERIEKFLQDDKLRVDIISLRREETGQQLLLGLADEPREGDGVKVYAGDRITLDIVVRNVGVGHTFPGGTNDSNEGWLEVTLLDEAGHEWASSGRLAENGHLDPLAHVYKAVLVDADGRHVSRRNVPDIRATVFQNVIPPGAADAAHYRFIVPPQFAGRTMAVRARLMWRKFTRPFTEFAFSSNPESFEGFDVPPSLPVTEIAMDEAVLSIGGAEPPVSGNSNVDPWIRINDYGIALLREGDFRGAARAFRRVASLRPNSIEGPLNLARTALRAGDLPAAYENVGRAEEIQPGRPRVAWVWATVFQEDGRYDEAARLYRRVLEAFPRDRATWRNLGRTHYLNGECEPALEAFRQVLSIDPEDRVSHYHSMLCHRLLGSETEAAASQQAYERYQIDESAAVLTRQFRLQNPGANLMSLPVRTHDLVLTGP